MQTDSAFSPFQTAEFCLSPGFYQKSSHPGIWRKTCEGQFSSNFLTPFSYFLYFPSGISASSFLFAEQFSSAAAPTFCLTYTNPCLPCSEKTKGLPLAKRHFLLQTCWVNCFSSLLWFIRTALCGKQDRKVSSSLLMRKLSLRVHARSQSPSGSM